MTIARILVVAGSDSGGGAGIQADIKTIAMLGGHPMTAITAITAQNTLGVEAVHVLPPEFVARQMVCVAEDLGVDAVKIGMLGDTAIATCVAEELAKQLWLYPRAIVFDPVMVATSGAVLADDRTIAAMDRLARVSALVTPNLPELAALCGRPVLDPGDAATAATDYAAQVGAAVLVKGGHAEGATVVDRLVDATGEVARWENARIPGRNTHGTGCTLASGIACGLGQGLGLIEATRRAIGFVRDALAAAPDIGSGHGPMGHALGRTPYDVMKRC